MDLVMKGKSTDVCVPLTRLVEAIDAATKLLQKIPMPGTIVGHVGDGNFHIFLPFDPNDKEQVQIAHQLGDDIARVALALNGTCTGEHGIGLGKKHLLPDEIGPAGIQVMKTIKAALDPKGLMSPGKVFV